MSERAQIGGLSVAQVLADLVEGDIAPGTSMPAGHPAAGKTQRDGKATAYLCVGPTCSLPVSDAALPQQGQTVLVRMR